MDRGPSHFTKVEERSIRRRGYHTSFSNAYTVYISMTISFRIIVENIPTYNSLSGAYSVRTKGKVGNYTYMQVAMIQNAIQVFVYH